MISHAEFTEKCGELVTTDDEAAIAKRIAEAGKRAAAEAEERRAKEKPSVQPTEVGGRKGPDPTRFGDWEINGIAVDF